MTTNLTRRLLVSAACIAALAAAAPAFAQTQTAAEPPAPSSASGQKATLIANVDIVSATSTVKGNVVSGSFLIQGKMGQQNGLVYGVVVANESGQYLTAEKLGEVGSVRDGEIKNLTFSYTLPAFLSGTVRVMLAVETASGLPLAYQQLFEKKMSGPAPLMSCALSGSSTVACKLSGSATIRVATRPSLFGQEEVVRASASGKKGDTITTEIKGTPGLRYAFVSAEGGETHILRVRVPGTFAKLVNVVVSEGKSGKILITSYIQASSATSSTISYTLKDAAGALCGEGSEKVTGSSSVIEAAASCTAGAVSVKLLGADGTVLDQRSEPFSSKRVGTAASGAALTMGMMVGIVIVAILAAVLLFAYMKRRRAVQQVTMMGVFVLLAVCSFGYRAEAATYAFGGDYGWITYREFDGGEPSVLAYGAGGTITLPTSVAPGQNYIVSITQQVNWADSAFVRCGMTNPPGPADIPCDGDDVWTALYKDSGYIGSVIANTSNGAFPMVAKNIGNEDISILQRVGGEYGGNLTMSCTFFPNCLYYSDYQAFWTIPINTNPTVQVWF